MNNNSNSISVIVQKGQRPPRHYWFSPKTLRKILVSFSFIFTLISSVAIGLSLFYLGDYFTFLSSKEALETKISNLELEIKDQNYRWDSEREKLENLALKKSDAGLGSLQLIKTLPDSKDLTSETLVEVDNIKLNVINNSLELKFHLSNQSEQSRISGRLFTMLKFNNKFIFYPSPKSIESIKFNEGEFFSIARFRKSLIPFSNVSLTKENIETALLNIVIFSLKGDLIFEKHLSVKDIMEI